jgi:hypothetical protein
MELGKLLHGERVNCEPIGGIGGLREEPQKGPGVSHWLEVRGKAP